MAENKIGNTTLADPADTTPLTFRGSWESDAFIALLRNTIAWGIGA